MNKFQIVIDTVYKPLLERRNAMQKIEDFVNKSVEAGCSREDVLKFLQANGIGNTPIIRRAQVLDNRAVVANPIPGQILPATVYKDLTGKTVAMQNNGVTAHLLDEGKAIITSDVTKNSELGYKVVLEDGKVTKLSTVYPSYELTLDANGNFVEKSRSIQEQIEQQVSETANVQKEVDACNDTLRAERKKLFPGIKENSKEILKKQ